jgi:hypothetical protein
MLNSQTIENEVRFLNAKSACNEHVYTHIIWQI